MMANHQHSKPSAEEAFPQPLQCALTQYTGFLLAKASQRLEGIHSANCAAAGIGPDIRLAGVLHSLVSNGPLSQQQAGQLLRIDRSSMVQLVDTLERAGLAVRRDNPRDRRAYLLEITETGRRQLAVMVKTATAIDRKLLSGFSEEELAILHRALLTLANLPLS